MVTLPHPTASYDITKVDDTNSKGVCNVTDCDGICVMSWIKNRPDAFRTKNYRCLIDQN